MIPGRQGGLQAEELGFKFSASLFRFAGRGGREFLTVAFELGNAPVQVIDFVGGPLQLGAGGGRPKLSFGQLILQTFELLARALMELLSELLLALAIAAASLEFQSSAASMDSKSRCA